MTDDEIAALRAAARAVPPVVTENGLEAWAEAAMRFRALAQPAAVLALLDEREALRAALKEMLREAECVDYGDDWIGRGVAAEKRDRARAALAGSAAP